jgi:hypothetical protein
VGFQRAEGSRKTELGLALQRLLQYADKREDTSTLNRIVTGDESWMLHYQPESKHASLQWKHPSSASIKF